jgi:hypothetical protein
LEEEKGLAVFFFSDGAKYLDYGMGLRSVSIGCNEIAPVPVHEEEILKEIT